MAKISVYVFAVDSFRGGESVYLRGLIKTFARMDYIDKIFVLVGDKKDQNIIDLEAGHLVNKVSYIKYHPFIKRFDKSFLNKLNKFILFIGLITGLLRFIKKANRKRAKCVDNSLIISPYAVSELLLFSCKYIVNPQDFRGEDKKETAFNPLRVLKRIMRRVIYGAVLKNSFIVVDSQHNKDDLHKFYGRHVKNCAIIRSLPDYDSIDEVKKCNNRDIYAQLRDKHTLFENYLFYPAHLIFDNNHLNLLEALRLIGGKYKKKVNVILSGGRNDLETTILKKVECYQLNVKYLNYISYSEVIAIMLNAKGLVYPSFIGPSLCIWEAFYLQIPVSCSKTNAFKEQIGEAGLLFDPNDVNDMAEKVYALWTDENMRKELVRKGYERIKDMTLENYAKQWEEVIEAAYTAPR
jgi:glycosyltransferase involved in cell wall biosynthesis